MQEWRHLDFFQHQAFLHARTPRITCPDCGVKQINLKSAVASRGLGVLRQRLNLLV